MILVDTAVWIDHFHRSSRHLVQLLDRNDVAAHEMVIGELALGSMAQRSETLRLLAELPRIATVSHTELMTFVDSGDLAGRGIGLVDTHLLAATLATPGTTIWTRDRRLAGEAGALGVRWEPAG